MAQFALPDADRAAGSWTPTPLWSNVDEGVASADGTTIASDAVGNNSSTTFADLRLSDVTDPAASSGHTIRAHWRHDQAGRTMAAHAELWQGIPGSGSQIASLDVDPDVGTNLTTSTYTLSAAEADAITDYTDLYVRLWGFGTGGGPSRSLVVDAVELETPDAAPEPPSGTGSMSGGGSLAGIGFALLSGLAALTGGGVLSGSGESILSGTGSISGGGSASGTGAVVAEGTSSISGGGVLSGTGEAPTSAAEGTGLLSGGGTITGIGSVASEGVSAISGGGALLGTGQAVHSGTGSVSGAGALSAIGEAVHTGTGSVSGGGSLNGTGGAPTGLPEGTGTIAGGGQLTGVGAVVMSAAGTLAGGGTLNGTGESPPVAPTEGTAAISGGGSLAGTGESVHSGTGALSGGGALAGSGARASRGSAALSGGGDLSGIGSALVGEAPKIPPGGFVIIVDGPRRVRLSDRATRAILAVSPASVRLEGGMPFTLRVGETTRPLRVRIVDGDASTPDLTGATVTFSMVPVQSTEPTVEDGACTVLSASPPSNPDEPNVSYDFEAADVAEPGNYWGEFKVDYGGGSIGFYPSDENIPVTIRKALT